MNITLLYQYQLAFSSKTKDAFSDDEESNFSCGSSLRDSLRNLGHNVNTFSLYHGNEKTGMHRCIDAIKSGMETDCVFLMHAGSLKKNLTELWDRKNFKSIPMIAEGGDEHQCLEWNFPHNSKADLVLTCDRESSGIYRQQGVNAEWFPVWADERVFFDDGRKRTIDISTTAVPTPTRNKRGFLSVNDTLSDHFGDKFKNPMRNRVGQGYIPMMENGDLFRESKIVFQFSSCAEMTRRIVEGAACGAMVITDRLHPVKSINSLFIEDKDIVFYSSTEECLEKMKFYLNNEKERQTIASNIYEKIMQKHTGLARAKDFVNHCNNYFGI